MDAIDDARPAPARGGPGARWRDAALVLCAHGASGGGAGDDPVLGLARALGRRGLFAEVAAGFVRGTPDLRAVVDGIAAETVYLVPFFMSDGYFTRTVIPATLGLDGPVTAGPGRRRILACAPAGASPRLALLVRRRVATVCRALGLAAKDVTVVLAGHGTTRDPETRDPDSAAGALALAGRLANEGAFADVRAGFLEQAPALAEVLADAPGRAAVVVGLFAAAGMHGAGDVPAVMRRAGAAVPLHYAGAAGALPGMATLVLERVQAFDAAAQE